MSLGGEYREAQGQSDSDSFVACLFLTPVSGFVEFSPDIKKVYQDVHVDLISSALHLNMLFQSAGSSFQLRKGSLLIIIKLSLFSASCCFLLEGSL